MNNFITGILAQNNDGATYEGVVYDRRLKLRLANGRELSIFDFADPISADLPTGEVYIVVIVPFVVSVHVVPAISPTESENWQGTVLDPDWEAPKNAFQLVRPELYEQRWALVATSHGNIILNPGNVGGLLSAGTIIQWKNKRFDLYAIASLTKQHPMFHENDVVKLKHAIPAQSPTAWPGIPSVDLAAGERGTVVTVYTNDSIHYEYEVEFVNKAGMTYGLLTLKEEDIAIL